MTRFNIVGRGFLDIEAGNAAGFTKTNPWFRFADVELGRSVEFSVPATTHNCTVLGFGDDPSEYGEMLRTRHTCQLVYDGGQIMGTLAVTAYASGQFSCVFLVGGSSWIDDLQNKRLSDFASDLHLAWEGATIPTDASSADPSQGVEFLKYEDGVPFTNPNWCVAPSVNVRYFINELMSQLNVPHSIAVDSLLYMVAGSLRNGEEDAVSFVQTDSLDVDVYCNYDQVEVVTTDVEWATAILFGSYLGGGSNTIKAFRAKKNIKMAFDADLGFTVPADIFLIKLSYNLKNCEYLGGYPSDMTGVDAYWRVQFHDLTDTVVEFKKGDVFFFADYFGFVKSANLWASSQILGSGYFGWKDNAHNLNIQARITSDSELAEADTWWLQYNMPDMTVFEFLKSVCLATGLELTVDPVDGITISAGSYGQDKLGQFKPLDRVLSIDRVARTAWGENTAAVVVGFDSDDYVADKLETVYGIPNDVNNERKEFKSKFSEGNVGDNGIFIADVDPATYKFKAKKWTLAYADPNKAYLQRINAPVAFGYHDIAANSTAVTVKALLPLADFLEMKPSTTWLWRGCAYLWQKASWSDGVLTMEMQRVSAQRQEIVAPTPPTPQDYVQDGLVLLMDGIEKGGTAGHWIDLVNGHDFEALGGVTFEDNCVTFDGINGYLHNNTFTTPSSNTGTIEIVFAKEGSTAQVLYAPKSGSQRLAFYLSSTNLLVWSIVTSLPSYQLQDAASVSVNNNGCYLNGSNISPNTSYSMSTSGTTYNRIGCRYNNNVNSNFLNGRIYCIRIYNRQLTADEVEANRQIDIARFGIGN